jgi:gluconolactonase
MGHSSQSPELERSRPASAFIVHAPEFEAVLGTEPRLDRVVDSDAHEGPVYAVDEDALYFTTLPTSMGAASPPRVAIKRVALDGDRFPVESARVSVVRSDANVANGMTLDRDGRLLVCEQGSRSRPAAVTRFDPATGAAERVVDAWRGLPLNSPNDVITKSDGTIWFTDPSYGHLQGFRPAPRAGDFVYRYDPRSSQLSIVADSLDKPNGLAFSPDGRVLYVTDSGANQEPGSYHQERPHHILAFDVHNGRRLENERLFAITTPGFPDGIKVDEGGRVYASAFSGVHVFDPGGELIGEIALPGAVNFAFGGRDRNILFVTTDDAIWAAVLKTTGAKPPASNPLEGA